MLKIKLLYSLVAEKGPGGNCKEEHKVAIILFVSVIVIVFVFSSPLSLSLSPIAIVVVVTIFINQVGHTSSLALPGRRKNKMNKSSISEESASACF